MSIPRPQSGCLPTSGGKIWGQNPSPFVGLGRVIPKQGSVIGPCVQFGTGLGGNGEVGLTVGECVGDVVAYTVGDRVGAGVGFTVGDGVGAGVGITVGVFVGFAVGDRVGELVGKVGAGVGANVGAGVGLALVLLHIAWSGSIQGVIKHVDIASLTHSSKAHCTCAQATLACCWKPGGHTGGGGLGGFGSYGQA